MQDGRWAAQPSDGGRDAPAVEPIARTRKLRDWVPPVLWRQAGALFGRHSRFEGRFLNWDEAARGLGGYEDGSILEFVRRGMREVVAGRAAAARDGHILRRSEPSYPLLVAILRSLRSGSAVVADFGGGLGSTYYECRPFLPVADRLRWNIVEQKRFVDCGRAEFETDVLRFFENFESAVADAPPDVVLFSGVLQYLRRPESALEQAVASKPLFIVVDRTPFSMSGRTELVRQRVPARLGGGRYPAWLFDAQQLFGRLPPFYRLLCEFDAVDGVLTHGFAAVPFKGFVFERTA